MGEVWHSPAMTKLDPKWAPIIAVAVGIGGGIGSWTSGYPLWDCIGMESSSPQPCSLSFGGGSAPKGHKD